MRRLSRTLVCIGLVFNFSVALSAIAAVAPDTSPNSAIQLVLRTQAARIRAADDPKGWWHDTKEREWSVQRPTEPGVLDTTHTFVVKYKINGTVVATWHVDTRTGIAVVVP